MSTWAVVFLFESFFLFTTGRRMCLLCIWSLFTGFRIDVSSTKLLTTFPTPRPTTAGTDIEIISIGGKPASKNIIACIIFETPPLTPGTLLGVHSSKI